MLWKSLVTQFKSMISISRFKVILLKVLVIFIIYKK